MTAGTGAGNRVAGHSMPHEGKPLMMRRKGGWPEPLGSDTPIGPTWCTCETWSPVLDSDAARKRWHRAHKDEIREVQTGG